MTLSLLLGALVFNALSAPAPGWRERLSDAIRTATSKNPELTRMDAEIRAAAERARQADALPDPELSVGAMNVPVNLSFDEDPMTMKTVGLTQTLPPVGMRKSARLAAEAGARAIEKEHMHHVYEVAARTGRAFFELAALDRKLVIARETEGLLADDTRVAEERYRVGRGVQADVLRASLEKTRLAREIAEMEGARRAAAAAFNVLLARPADTAVPPIEAIDPDIALPERRALLARALSESPILAHYDQEVERAEQEARRARLERRPMWSLSATYGERERRDDMVSATVGISLPFLHPVRLSARATEAGAMLEAARAERSEVEYRLRGDVESALARLESDRKQAVLYRETILPQAEINDRAARESYAVGSIDFATLVAASIDLQTFRSEYADRLSAIGRDRADLQTASGLPLLPGTPGMEHDHEAK
ncbi:MAG TPA: TolC family protein [Thermoanaerobaculia bacterium]|jgi:cobalt-zinc-cadmium efflux system outer membrane protein|nr:TolC family protein [Thermoanaerobaculia bacterium]